MRSYGARQRFCVICDTPFVGGRRAKYCTGACRSAAYREARKAYDAGRPARRRKTKANPDLARVRGALNRFKAKEIMRKRKLELGCADCGYKGHHAGLDFDHVRGDKEFDVATIVSLPALYREMEKCDVVCARCHRIRTYNMAQLMKPINADILARHLEAERETRPLFPPPPGDVPGTASGFEGGRCSPHAS